MMAESIRAYHHDLGSACRRA